MNHNLESRRSDPFLYSGKKGGATKIIKLKYGVLAERCATRKNSAAEIRKRKFREEVKLERATRATRSSLKTGSRRGQGHRGTSTGVTGQALIEKNNRVEE
ncbi:hypothetical protein HZH66_008846 [Vespula vulgaris]|uniref:Uncharacterized protein n=2 Tax=Vespula TaxID=7451 RepID=A0A834JQA9_VESVU|nr:hypothetical protein HZH66_008846 [Vespula vulgaris]